MPTYTYNCLKCNKFFNVIHNISQDSYKKCSQIKKNNCDKNGELIRKITGGSGLIFKGQGFYLTDYSNKKNKKITKKENGNDKNDSSK